MFEKLKIYCKSIIDLTDEELNLIDNYFEIKLVKKKDFLLQDGKVCDFIGFVEKGIIRHFHIKDGVEKTCDISFENAWVTDFQSFNNGTVCIINLQAIADTTVFCISKTRQLELYNQCSKYETFGRIMAEQVAVRATEIAMSLSSEKPEERFQNLLQKQPDLFQSVPQKHIANFLGISPESLSRIQKRIYNKQKS
jgi:CRP-like cAMP-binding protein